MRSRVRSPRAGKTAASAIWRRSTTCVTGAEAAPVGSVLVMHGPNEAFTGICEELAYTFVVADRSDISRQVREIAEERGVHERTVWRWVYEMRETDRRE